MSFRAQLGKACIALCLSAIFLFSACHEEKKPGEVPLVSLKTYSGDTYTVSPKDTLVTLIVFWATWCGPCKMEMPGLVDLQTRYANRGFRVVGINIDDPEGTKAHLIMEHFGINYPMLIGDDALTRKFGGLNGIPTSFLVGRDGILKDRTEGAAPEELLEAKIVPQL